MRQSDPSGSSRRSRELGHEGIELDARLALAEIERKAGQTAAGHAHLGTIEAAAKAKGYNLLARKAAQPLSGAASIKGFRVGGIPLADQAVRSRIADRLSTITVDISSNDAPNVHLAEVPNR
jgi:hypothetical protein